jgi:hypothetical protein
MFIRFRHSVPLNLRHSAPLFLSRWHPRFDFSVGFAEVACFFVYKTFEVVAHTETVEVGVGLVVPLREQGK